MNNIFLEPKLVGDIEGEFLVPSYSEGISLERRGRNVVERYPRN